MNFSIFTFHRTFFMAIDSFITYLELEKNYSQHTLTAYKKDLTSFSEFALSEYEVDDLSTINYSIIRSWIVTLVESGIANKSINRKISSLRTYYKYLLKIGSIEVSPLAKHKSLKVSKKLQVPFSEKEITTVLEQLQEVNDFESARNKLIIELFYATGMRRAELVQLKLTDISIPNKTIKVLGKRKKERIIPLLPTIIGTLQEYILYRDQLAVLVDASYLLLTIKGTKIYDTLVYRIITSYFNSASEKIKKSPHILRHTFATHLLNEGADLKTVKELLGHASLASTQVYTHNSIAKLKEVYKNSHPRNSN